MRIELRNLTANADLYLEDASGQAAPLLGEFRYRVSIGSWLPFATREPTTCASMPAIAAPSATSSATLRDAGWSTETAINLGNLTNVSTARTRSGIGRSRSSTRGITTASL